MCLCFGFTPDLKNVLMVDKTKGPDVALGLNGVGGKLEPCEPSETGMRREWSEETNTDIEHLLYLQTMIFSDGSIVEVFGAVLSEDAVEAIPRKNDVGEQLLWMNAEDVLQATVRDSAYAGYGNVPYFVGIAREAIISSLES